jgi:uncharacterized membrane protein
VTESGAADRPSSAAVLGPSSVRAGGLPPEQLGAPGADQVPSRTEQAARAASEIVGGPWGRHGVVNQRRFWTPLRVLLALTLVTLSFGWLQKSPCQDGGWQHGLQYTHFCYSDVIPLFYEEQLNTGAVPYKDHAIEYPVLTGGFMGLAAWIARKYDHAARPADGQGSLLPELPPVQTYFMITAILLTICMLVITWSTAALSRRRVWDAAMVALSPLLIVHAFTNWDLLAIALAGVAMVAWQRRRPTLAGVFIGLGTAAKLYPALFLVPLLALCIRTRKYVEFGWCLFGALLAWAAVNLPIAMKYGTSWRRFFDLNKSRPADFDTLWYAARYLIDRHAGRPTGVPNVNALAAVAVVLAVGAVFVLALRAPRRPRLAQLLFLTVAAFLLTNKVWSPQYSLWLMPLAVLARPSWRAYLAWQATECLVWVPRLLWFLGTSQKGVDFQWFLLAVLLRDAAVITYCALIIRDILQPERDLVRASGVDDPAGGILDEAEDVPYAFSFASVGAGSAGELSAGDGSPGWEAGGEPGRNDSREHRNNT